MFPDLSLGRPLPVQDAIEPQESGNGYALRMVVANHLEFCDLTRALCTIGHRYLPFSAAATLAYWFGAGPVAVARSFPRSYKARGHLVTQLMGAEFNRPYHIRVSRPQLCAVCLQEGMSARVLWDVSLVTCCPRHKIRLVDWCPSCHRALRWRRPNLVTCLCGYDFRCASSARGTPDEIWLSARIEDLLFGDSQGHVDDADAARRLLVPLGLDPLLRVVRTLGIAPDGDEAHIVPGKITRLLTTDEAMAVVARAFSRLRSILTTKRLTRSAAPIPLGEARSLCDESLGPHSYVLHDVLTRIARVESHFGLAKPASGQLSLFAEAP